MRAFFQPLATSALLLRHAATSASAGHSLTRTTFRSGISLSPLTTYRQTAPMTKSTIATYLNKTLDIEINLFAEVTLYPVVLIDNLADSINLLIRKVLKTGIGIDPGLLQYFSAQGRPYAIYVA